MDIHTISSEDDPDAIKDYVHNAISRAISSGTGLSSGAMVASKMKQKLISIANLDIGSDSNALTSSRAEAITQTIIRDVKQAVQLFYDPSYFPFSVDEVIAAVHSVFDTFETSHDVPSVILLRELLCASPRIGLAISNSLLPLYRKILFGALTSAKDTFSSSLKKVPANPLLQRALLSLSESIESDFEKSAREIRKGLFVILCVAIYIIPLFVFPIYSTIRILI